MRPVRSVGVLVGVLATAYGVWLLLDLGWANTRSTLLWLVGGVVLHDGVFSVLVLGVALVAVRLVPRDRLAPWVVGLVILVPVTLAGIPELGRFGARPDNPTLLDRHYWLGWSAMATLVVLGVLVGAVASRRRTPVRGGDDDARAGGR
jgi:cytochrome b561